MALSACRPRPVNVRVIAATNREIDAALGEGSLREDLYYRLAVIEIELPPLRQRPEDVPLLVRHFIDKYAGGRPVEISDAASRAMTAYPWPGNVRELQNAIERMVVLMRGERLDLPDLPVKIRELRPASGGKVLNLPDDGYSLEALEKEAVIQALERNQWNQTRAAAFLQVPRHTLLYRMEKYNIEKP